MNILIKDVDIKIQNYMLFSIFSLHVKKKEIINITYKILYLFQKKKIGLGNKNG